VNILKQAIVLFLERLLLVIQDLQLVTATIYEFAVENGDEVIIENRLGNDITFRITVTETTDERDVWWYDPPEWYLAATMYIL
jgi:hypothetical protein